ncbi:MAG TPA: HD domain-containing phosphohydrolase [Gemmatimonadaceae bacterium]|nr:HD domain-containing phosphohydrolase [Gemmatimonadaceae bacterium]
MTEPTYTVPRLLLVDDEATILTALAKFLRSRSFDVHTATSGDEALAKLSASGPFKLMLCDVRMPGLTGVEVVSKALAIDPDLAIVMLTGVNDAPTATDALARGAFDYLLKPVELADLHQAIERSLHRRDLLIDRRNIDRVIREEVDARTKDLQEMSMGTIHALINAMEAKDIYLRGHSERIAELAASIAEVLGLDPDTVENVRVAGRLHDVGQIGIRESVLNKPGPLTPDEYEHVKEHVWISMDILKPLTIVRGALEYIQDHHERWDGQGYPKGKAGEDISIGGRILAAADAFDALTSHRAYREPRSPKETLTYLESHVGGLLDPRIYEALTSVVRGRKTLAFSFIDDTH